MGSSFTEPLGLARVAGPSLTARGEQRIDLYAYEGRRPFLQCPDVASPTSVLGIELTLMAPGTITVGTFPVVSSFTGMGTPRVEAEFFQGDGSFFGQEASGGSVTLDEVGPTISGTYSLMFGTDTVSGAFSLPLACRP